MTPFPRLPTSTKPVILLGGTGAVGGLLFRLLTEYGLEVMTLSRRGTPAVDLTRDPQSLSHLSDGAALVINATGIELPEVAAHSRAPFLDISATPRYLLDLAQAPPPAGVILGVGLAPGLTTLLAREVSTGPDDEVDVALILGVGEHHGPAAREWTGRLLGASFASPGDAGPVRNFTRARTLPIPGRGRRRVLRADFPDGAFAQIARAQVRSYLGLTSRAATLALNVATYAPRLLGPMLAAPLPGSADWSITATSRTSGRSLGARGTGQSMATAQLTALTAVKAIGVAKAIDRESTGETQFMANLVNLQEAAGLTGITLVRLPEAGEP